MNAQRIEAGDWCHLCGKRENPAVSMWYPANAEHPVAGDDKFLRVCIRCIELLCLIVTAGGK